MADTRVEDIESNSDSSGFNNDDFSDDFSETFLETQIVKKMKCFEGFPIQMPENVNWALRRATCPAENRMICTYMTNLVKDLL